MKNLNCREAKELLQEAVDQGKKIDADCAAHLDDCGECRAFQAFLSSYPARLAHALDTRVMPAAPSGERILARRRVKKVRRTIAWSLSGLAAAVIISVGGLLVASMVEREQTARSVSEENNYFVDDLFSRPVFEGIEYLAVND